MQSIEVHLGRAWLLPRDEDIWLSLTPTLSLSAWYVHFSRIASGMPDAPLYVQRAVRVRPLGEPKGMSYGSLLPNWEGADDLMRAAISAGAQRGAVMLTLSLLSFSKLCRTWLVEAKWHKITGGYEVPSLTGFAGDCGYWFVAFADDLGRPCAMVVPITERKEEGGQE